MPKQYNFARQVVELSGKGKNPNGKRYSLKDRDMHVRNNIAREMELRGQKKVLNNQLQRTTHLETLAPLVALNEKPSEINEIEDEKLKYKIEHFVKDGG